MKREALQYQQNVLPKKTLHKAPFKAQQYDIVLEKPTLKLRQKYVQEKLEPKLIQKIGSEKKELEQKLENSTKSKFIKKITGETYIITRITKVDDPNPVTIKQYSLEGVYCQLHIPKYIIIVEGRLRTMFHQNQEVGVYIPKGNEGTTIVIKRQRQYLSNNFMDYPYIIVNPYQLVAPTEMFSWNQCRRQITLGGYITYGQITNVFFVLGNACHSYLQYLVKKQISGDNQQGFITVYNKLVYEMFLIGYSLDNFLDYCQKSLRNIRKFYQKYLKEMQGNVIPIYIKGKLRHIEINKIIGPQFTLRSQYFGLKGKIDLLLAGDLITNYSTNSQTRTQIIIPFQLKTGSNESQSHRKQLDVYNMLARQRFKKQVIGLLYYSQTDKIINRQEQASQAIIIIMMIRNEIIMNRQRLNNCVKEIVLPDYTSNIGNCVRKTKGGVQVSLCDYAWQCGAINRFDKVVRKKCNEQPQNVVKQIKELLHRNDKLEYQYYNRWLKMIHYEENETYKADVLFQQLDANKYEITPEELKQLKRQSTFRIKIKLQKIFEEDQINIYDNFQNYFQPFQRIKLHIPQIDLIEGCRIIDIKKTIRLQSKLIIIHLQFNNLQIDFNEKRLNTLKSLEMKGFAQIQKYQNSSFASMRGLISKFIQSGKPWIRKLVIESQKRIIELQEDYVWENSESDEVGESLICCTGLNENQKKALIMAQKMQKFLLIEGMPGTGKTFLIVKMIQMFYKEGKKLLIATFTNRSLDNIIQRLLKENMVNKDHISRQGSQTSIAESLIHLNFRSKNFNKIIQYETFFNSKSIWFVTMSSLFVPHLPQNFDVVIVDEASQCLQPLCLDAINRGDKFILIGDYKQLEPVVKSQESRYLGMGRSLLQKMCLKYNSSMVALKIQYRMCKKIMELSNTLVYQGKLQANDVGVQNQQLKMIQNWQNLVPKQFKNILDPKQEVVFLNIDQIIDQLSAIDKKSENVGDKLLSKIKKAQRTIQIQVCCFLYQQLIKITEGALQQKKDNIAIISAYNSSISSIVAHLVKNNVIQLNLGNVLTIDKSQGIDKNAETNELIDNIKRLNVGLTRAKAKLIIVGSQLGLMALKAHKGLFSQLIGKYKINLTKEHLNAITYN